MAFRTALMPLTAISDAGATVGKAIAVAQELVAHLDALFVRPDPEETFAYTGLEPDDFDLATQEVRDKVDRHGKAAAERARRRFYAVCDSAGVPRVRKPEGGSHATASWHEVKGEPTLVVPEVARYSDAVIFSGALARYSVLFENVLEATLLRSGRPVLLLPSHSDTPPLGRALIAWDGGTACARAVSAWLASGLARGPASILHISETDQTPSSLDGVCTHLQWHGLDADIVHRRKGFDPVAQTLLAEAEELGAGLLVMGGYGKSRYREAVFGGVTRHVIRHARVPVLLMH